MQAQVNGRPARRPLPIAIGWLVLALAAVAAPPARADEFTRTTHYSIRMFSFGTLTIDTRIGDVTVEGWDYPRLEVDAEKLVRAGSKRRADVLYDKIGIRLRGQDKKITLTTLLPARRVWRPFRGESKLTVNYTIRMPYDANLIVRCVDGDVTVHGLTKQIFLRVNYGDVEVELPDVYRLRSLKAHTALGYVESDLRGVEQDSAGLERTISFVNGNGDQDVFVSVHMGGVFIYTDE